MANFTIDYDITMSGCIDVEANSEDEARHIALAMLKNDPYYFAKRATHHVDTDITDIY